MRQQTITWGVILGKISMAEVLFFHSHCRIDKYEKKKDSRTFQGLLSQFQGLFKALCKFKDFLRQAVKSKGFSILYEQTGEWLRSKWWLFAVLWCLTVGRLATFWAHLWWWVSCWCFTIKLFPRETTDRFGYRKQNRVQTAVEGVKKFHKPAVFRAVKTFQDRMGELWVVRRNNTVNQTRKKCNEGLR